MIFLLPYNRRNPLALINLLLRDLYYWLYAVFFRSKIALPKNLTRILLVNPVHLGDIVISTALLRDLKQRFPECEVDFLVGQWGAPIMMGHPGIRRSYFINHWQANRGNETNRNKRKKYQQQVQQVASELSSNRYDAIFFLNSYEPSLISLFRQVQCPLIGFISAGGGPLLSYVGDSQAIHEVQIQASLFVPWLGRVRSANQYRPWLKPPLAIEVLMDQMGLMKPYVVIHPGSGNPAKEWPIENWMEVVEHLSELGWNIVITGHGEREKKQADLLKWNRCTNLVGQLNFDQFAEVIARASFILCVDSVAGHIASAYDKDAVIIGNGLSKIERWQPLGKNSHLLVKQMPCSPCHSRPCAERPCITSVTPQMLFDRLPQKLV